MGAQNWSNFLLFQAPVDMLARANGMGYQAGLTEPADEHVVLCLPFCSLFDCFCPTFVALPSLCCCCAK
jgi:hypothetical protein